MAKSDMRLLLENGVRDLRNDPEWADLLDTTVARLNAGFYDPIDVDLVVQKKRRRYGVVDAFVFSEVHSALLLNQIALVELEVGAPPVQDRRPGALNAQLAHLPHPFTARCEQDEAGLNAQLRWSEVIYLVPTEGDENTPEVTLPPGSAALLIGYTPCEYTLAELANRRKLARWPDGYTSLFLLAVVDDKWYGPPKPVSHEGR